MSRRIITPRGTSKQALTVTGKRKIRPLTGQQPTDHIIIASSK